MFTKTSCMSHKIYDNNLILIRQSTVALKLNKPPYDGMCILKLSKIWMFEFHFDYIKNKNDNKFKLLFTDTSSLMYVIKTEDVYEDFSSDKEMFNLSNCSTKSKCYDNSNKLVLGKIKDETSGVAIEEFVRLKPNMYSFLVGNHSEHKKTKGVNRNVVATISHNEYRNVLLNNKFLIHSMNSA